MKNILKFLLGFLFAFCAGSRASALTIEDDAIAEVGNNISSVVYGDRSYIPFKDYSCKIVGEKIPLSATPTATTYFLTTANACGWGAALGPIWLVRTEGGATSVVLSSGGYSIDVLKEAKHAMHNVRIRSATTARSASVIYEFDGLAYKRCDKKH